VTTNREINYIFAPDGLAAIYEKKNGTGKMYYVSTDNLGSINMIADEQGNIVNDLSYDAWGRRRDPATWQQLTIAQATALQPTLITDRGYTLHEHIDAFGLINMNGRAYDPLVGQFLSPDPFIQSTTSAQSYNRYSYCWNNPLKFVDPSGYYTIDIDGLQINTSSQLLMGIINNNWNNTTSINFSNGIGLSWGDINMKSFDMGRRGGKIGFWLNEKYHYSSNAEDISGFSSLKMMPDILKNVYLPRLNVSCKFIEFSQMMDILDEFLYGGFESHAMSTSYENNEDNEMRERNMIQHNPQPQIYCTYSALPTHFEVGISYTYATPYGGFTVGFSYIYTPEEQGLFVDGGPSVGISQGFSLSLNNYSPKNGETGPMLDEFIGWQETNSGSFYVGVNDIHSVNSVLGQERGLLYNGAGINIGNGFGISTSRTYSIKLFSW